MKLLLILMALCSGLNYYCLCETVNVDAEKIITWGPGLQPDVIVLPARYFFVQLVDSSGKNLTEAVGNLDVYIGHSDKTKKCRVWWNILNRNDGTYIVRYKVTETCASMIIDLRFDNHLVSGFPLLVKRPVLPDKCNCPKDLTEWKNHLKCASSYEQIEKDLEPFKTVNMLILRKKILMKFNKRGSMSLCHYIILNNVIHRKCYGQYVGFHVFMDAMLLSLARKVHLPNLEFFVNLGDWPLEEKGPQPLPIFSWCGSEKTADIVMPTYDLTESTLECMGRVQLDMLSVQGNLGPTWSEKKPQAFWRGRDSRRERLKLIDLARANPDLFNASLTNFFFFRDKEEEYGPKQPHISFFKFFEYKYQINIDGTVASYRFPYLLAGDSLVLKQKSQYYEHFYHDLHPGEHYVPFAEDLSDLVEKVKWARENDEEAQKISKAGSDFARNHLMSANIFCYQAALLEEWGKRLTSAVKVLPEMELVSQPQLDEPCECGFKHDEL